MRHRKHRHSLGVKKEHRFAMVAALASALFTHRRIQTTLAKAKALRPFAEKLITLAKKAAQTEAPAGKLHYRRLAAARLRNPAAVQQLFDEHAAEFLNRSGGYTRIYKLTGPYRPNKKKVSVHASDTAMALIEIIPAGDEGYKKTSRRKSAPKGKKSAAPAAAKPEAAAETVPAPTSAAPAADQPAEAPAGA